MLDLPAVLHHCLLDSLTQEVAFEICKRIGNVHP